jgi:hypothetical protein
MESPKPATDNSLNEHFALWQILILIFCSIVVAILKMETGRNFAMSGINSGHHYNLPTYEISLKSNNVEFVPSKKFYWSPFSKWPPQYRTNSTLSDFNDINSGHHYLPTYHILMISDNVEFLWYCGGHFENGDR